MEKFDLNDFLKSLNMSSEAVDCAFEIHKIAIETFKQLLPPFYTRQENFRPKSPVKRRANQMEICQQNVMRLIDLLERYDSPCAEFKKNFPLWERTRIENIAFLNDTVESLNKDRTICNILSVSSNSVAAVGSLTILGALIFPPAAPFIVPVAVGGMVTAGAGGATSFATSVADVSLLRKHIKKAQKICERDQSNSKLLGKWMTHTEELQEAMANLMGFSIWMKMWENLRNLKDATRDLRLSAKYSKFVSVIKRCVLFAIQGKLALLELGIPAAASVLTTLIAMILFHHRTQYTLEICKLGLGVLGGAEAGVEVGKLITAAAARAGSAGAKLIPEALAARVAFGVLAGVGLAVEVTMIVLSSMELANGGICKEGQNIRTVSKLLEDERKALRDVYEAMVARMNYEDWHLMMDFYAIL